MNARHSRRRDDDGATTVELVLWTGVAVLLLSIAILIARGTSAAIDVGNAADAGARAASQATTAATAARAARTTVAADLAAADSACRAPRTRVDTSAFRPGGQVTVSVSCTVTLADLPMPGVTVRSVSATATEPIDTYKVIG